MGNYKSASGQLQNNVVNGAMSITIDRVITTPIQIQKKERNFFSLFTRELDHLANQLQLAT